MAILGKSESYFIKNHIDDIPPKIYRKWLIGQALTGVAVNQTWSPHMVNSIIERCILLADTAIKKLEEENEKPV